MLYAYFIFQSFAHSIPLATANPAPFPQVLSAKQQKVELMHSGFLHWLYKLWYSRALAFRQTNDRTRAQYYFGKIHNLWYSFMSAGL